MKKVTLLLVCIMLMPALALGQTLSPDYGTELAITTDFKFPSFDVFGKDSFNMSDSWPVWSPDGQWLAFSSGNRLWRVPVGGGNAEMMYEFVYENEIRNIMLGLPHAIGFSSDGSEIFFDFDVYDESRGAEIEISGTSTDYHFSFSKPSIDVMGVNVETGESRTLIRDVVHLSSVMSHNGRMICSINRNNDTRADGLFIVYDLETGNSWKLLDAETLARAGFRLTDDTYIYPTFGHDDSYIIAKQLFGDTSVYQVPLNGGDLVPYTFYDGSAIGEYIYSDIDFSSDGTWTLYTSLNTSVVVSDSVETDPGSGYSYTHGIERQCVYNNLTGDNYYLLPGNPNVTTSDGKFSPDVSKYCYVLRDWDNQNKFYSIFVKDFDPSTLEKIVDLTAVESEGPGSFAVLSNYPNPFNPATTIEFSIPEADMVSLAVYNTAGQKIRELAAGYMPRGSHSVVWDGKDDSGNLVSSGVYFSRLVSGKNVQSLPMMLVK